uniref:Uncharacterized protein n=1 Tax=virus sp. ctmTa7 TaxID=2828255 RepID=A0A8S5RCL1_9VIRU|nr:MAG TPA: hypothetical protein [virus sp. ctmTa7]
MIFHIFHERILLYKIFIIALCGATAVTIVP